METNTVTIKTNSARRRLIRGPFVRLMLSNIFVLIATCACCFVDNLFVGQLQGTDSLAAIGFFSPVSMAIGIAYLVIMGTQVLSGKFIGQGEGEKVDSLFNSSFLIIALFFALFSVFCFVFCSPLSSVLGASGKIHALLCDYIRGYAFGILPQALVAFFMSMVSFNNEIKRSYISTFVMVVGNALGDWLLAPKYGIFGIGLASTLSSLASLIVLVPGFIPKRKVFHLHLKFKFSFKLLGAAIVRGWPSLMFSLGMIIKNYLFNYTLNGYSGGSGVAVVNVMYGVCSVIGSVPGGVAAAFATLAGLYYGEEDRDSYLELAKNALGIGVLLSVAAMLLFLVFSYPLSLLFFPSEPEARTMSVRMFMLAFTFLLPNTIYNVLIKSFVAQGKMTLPNILSFLEVTCIGVFVLLFVPIFGLDAAWLSNCVIDLVLLIFVMITAFVYRKRIDFSLATALKLPDDFGVQESDYLEYSVDNVADVSKHTDQVMSFCRSKGFPEKRVFHVALCIEEMAVNVLTHGFDGKKKYSVDVRLVSKNGFTVRIRDNCREFDPRARLDLFAPKEPEKNIGIRIVARNCIFMDYYNNAGINTLVMKF